MKINRGRVAFYLDYIRRGRHFEIHLMKYGCELRNVEYDAILATFVEPILPATEQAFLFWNTREIVKPPPKPPLPTACLAKTGSYLEFDARSTPIDNHREFWRFALRGMKGAAGNLVLCVPIARIPLAQLAASSWDPHYLTNPGAGVSSAALSYCKSAARSGGRVACLFLRDAMGLSMSFYAQNAFLEEAYIACVKACRFTGTGLEKELRGERHQKVASRPKRRRAQGAPRATPT